MNNEQRTRENRRRLLAMAGGSLLSANLIPETWTRPVLRSVVLPAHAQTTSPQADTGTADSTPEQAPEDIFTITCSAVCFNNVQNSTTIACVQGQLLASDDTDMSGVSFQVAWNFPSGPNVVTEHVADADGFFGTESSVCSPSQSGVFSSVNVVVSFLDQGTFGTNTCESTPICTS